MNIRDFLIRFAITFAVTFVVSAIVVYLWNLVRYGDGAFNWYMTFVLAITVGIILPLVEVLRSRSQQ